mmetsp:Transcript_85993/g.224180  ORF Transcript_85993/g.224180 Transcript_85993/m.224180 type:complete len:494 (+) Transcript_85993:110-1591(+)
MLATGRTPALPEDRTPEGLAGLLHNLGQSQHRAQHEVRGDSSEDARGDGVRKRSDDDRQEGRQGEAQVQKVDVPNRRHHQRPHQHEARCCGLGRNELDQGNEHRGAEEQHSRRDRAEPRSAALLNASTRLVVDDDRARAHDGAHGRAQGAAQVGELRARQRAVLVEQPRLLADAVLDAGRVEDDDEEHAEDGSSEGLRVIHRGAEVQVVHAGPGERRGVRGVAERLASVLEAQGVRREGSEDDAQDRRTLDFADEEGSYQQRRSEGEPKCRLGQIAQTHHRGVALDDEAHELKSDESLEHTDRNRDRRLQRRGKHGLRSIGDATGSQQREKNCLDEDAGQGCLGSHAHLADHSVPKVGIQAHACRQPERQVRGNPYEAGSDGRREARRSASCVERDGRASVVVRRAQYHGVHYHDVAHGNPCHQPCLYLLADRAPSSAYREQIVEVVADGGKRAVPQVDGALVEADQGVRVFNVLPMQLAIVQRHRARAGCRE